MIEIEKNPPLFTSLFQGGIRYNSYIFLAISYSILGDDGVALAGIFIAYMIVFTNIISVIVLNHYGEGGKKSILGAIKALAKNPLIIGAAAGLILNNQSIHLNNTLSDLMRYLGYAAMPLSLMSVGAGLKIAISKTKIPAISYSTVAKLAILPLLTICILYKTPTEGNAFIIAVLYSAVPCAGNSYILSKQMGGDAEAMASIITLGTIISSLSIPIIISLI